MAKTPKVTEKVVEEPVEAKVEMPVIVEGHKETLALSDEELYNVWANERDENPSDIRVLVLLQALAVTRGIIMQNWEARYTA